MTQKALDNLETCYIDAITNWHKYYNALDQEEQRRKHVLNEQMHDVFRNMQDIIRISRFGTDEDIIEYSRKV